MSEEKKTSAKSEIFSWIKVIVSAIIIALFVDFVSQRGCTDRFHGVNDSGGIKDYGAEIVL